MTIWIFTLRCAGAGLLIIGVLGGCVRMILFAPLFLGLNDAYNFLLPVVESLALALLCFGAATALVRLREIDRRIARATSHRRAAQQPEVKDLAPVAPEPANTAKYTMPRPETNPRHVRRIDQEYYTYRTPSTKRHTTHK